jgi:hypothetical protein
VFQRHLDGYPEYVQPDYSLSDVTAGVDEIRG